MTDFKDFINRFGGPGALVKALASLGITIDGPTVRQWRLRNSIPADNWWMVVQAAAIAGVTNDEGAAITADDLARWASKYPVAAE